MAKKRRTRVFNDFSDNTPEVIYNDGRNTSKERVKVNPKYSTSPSAGSEKGPIAIGRVLIGRDKNIKNKIVSTMKKFEEKLKEAKSKNPSRRFKKIISNKA